MKRIWIFNHYATNTFFDHAGRHYYFAKYLRQSGYDVTIFCASTVHNSDKNLISDNTPYSVDTCDGIPYVFIKTRNYKGNGKQRVFNMLDYYRGLFRATKGLEKPDVIIGSSVHPLACLAALRLSKKYKCRNILEIRDLWPESMVAYGVLEPNHFLTKLLYQGEKWLYCHADDLIFTMEGGRDYLIEKGWDKNIKLQNVHHINNGIDLNDFQRNESVFQVNDIQLQNPSVFKVIYVGSIRQVNGLEELLEVAQCLERDKNHQIQILVYGDGDERDRLEILVQKKNLRCITFKGYIDKKYVPYILSQGDLNLIHVKPTPIMRYGCSLNKMFDYLASGKPIIFNIDSKYNPISKFECGISKNFHTAQEYADAIGSIAELDSASYDRLCENARQAATEFDFKKLTAKLIHVLEK